MELTDILQRIDSLKQEAENLQQVKPELGKVFWDKFRLEFNYNSNHMEGNTLTYGHTQILLKSGDVVGKYNIRELQEMKAHDLALKVIRESADDPEFSLSQKFIREINQTILVEPFYNDAITEDGRPSQKLIIPGEYKKTPNSVRMQNGEMFNYPSPEETPALMGDLIDWYEKETAAKELHPVQIAALFHYKIVRIHPFDDSNGRTSRLLMNYILLKNHYTPLVINSTDKKNYLIALNEADAGDIGAFVKYITILQLHWQELYLKALNGEKIEDPDDFDKEVELLKKRIDRDKKIKAKFSKEIVLSLFSDCFFDLFNTCIDKISKLDHFFYEKEIQFVVSGQKGITSDVYKIEQLFLKLHDKINEGTSLDLEIRHRGFKTIDNGIFNYTTPIQIYFREYIYQVRLNPSQKPIIEKFYNEQLTSAEIEEIALLLAKEELNEIKKRQ